MAENVERVYCLPAEASSTLIYGKIVTAMCSVAESRGSAKAI